MPTRLTDEYEPVVPRFYDHPDDLEPAHMPLDPPKDWTEVEEKIRLLVLSAATEPRAKLFGIVREIIRLAVRAHQLKNAKNPEFVRK